MDNLSKPTKEDVREWQKRRQDSHTPPDRDQIRRELGWKLLEKPPTSSRS